MKKNRITICGRKTSTPPTPAITPSTSRLRSQPGASTPATASPRAAVPASIQAMGRSAPTKTAWKTTNSSSASSSGPSSGCSTTRSMRSLPVCGSSSARPRRCRMRCTSSWSGSSGAASVQVACAAAPRRSARRLARARSRAGPAVRAGPARRRPARPRCATTGTPSSRDSASSVDGQARGAPPGRPCSAPPRRAGRAGAPPAPGAGCAAGWWRRRRRPPGRAASRPERGRTARRPSRASSGERGCRL